MINSRKSTSRKGRKDSGVSEIIGDILILGITVTLFSTIFLYVNAFPTPNAQTYADFNASLASTGQLAITHEGGQILTSSLTAIVVQINQSTSVYSMSQGLYITPQNTSSLWSLPRWSTGQTWAINLTGTGASSIVSVSIIDRANNYLVWSTVLNGQPKNLKPVIQNAYASPNPVTPGKQIVVYAVIYGTQGKSNNFNLTANLSLVSGSNNVSVPMTYNSASGLYSTKSITTSSANLTIGQSYPITVTVTGPGKSSSNYTFMLSVERTGPTIVTASINPNPSTPGAEFNITAYVIDSTPSAFNPAAGIGNVTVTPQGPNYITNLSSSAAATVHFMESSQYEGVFVLSGIVNGTANYTSFETFKITATDLYNNTAVYVVELFLNYFLNPNQYYPSKFLGPASMSYSGFSWNVSGSHTYNSGFMIATTDVDNGAAGIYLHISLANNNQTSNLYLDALSNIYLFTGANNGFVQFESFVVLNGTHGAEYANWSLQHSNPGNPYSIYNGTSMGYPSMHWSTSGPGTSWGGNYSITGSSPSATNFVLLPTSVGGVQVPVQVTFGAYSSDSVPQTGGPFSLPSGSAHSTHEIAPGSVSANFLELFGYLLPNGESPWQYFPMTYGVPYGQTIPFTGIYWY
ncbi:MAG: type IV pilin [Candidatus Thermoplasmatota archaeon]|nr:type IV pilin [Candidatus Thermoplasmatota archaeon]MCL5252581.1 type IV pilin [Candidatus Thermoplasmatota archaeon]